MENAVRHQPHRTNLWHYGDENDTITDMKNAEQLIFIDDSGDPGFKIAKGASRMFVIACVIFDDYVDAEFASASLKILKKQLGWKQEREFKFHRATEEQKSVFFRALKPFNFCVQVVVMDKARVTEPFMKKDDSFYQRIILLALNNIKDMRKANIYLDGKAGKNYRNRSVAKIRQTLNGNARRMAQFKLEDSKDNVLIQLADMIAGSIRAKYDPEKSIKKDHSRLIRDNIDQLYFYKDGN